jgi:hypothetical protein
MDMHGNATTGRNTAPLYARLEERIIARDQVGASEVFYELVRAGRPLNEIIAESVRIHAPYTHVPYHERIDDGYPNFVNNDHCLLSARATLHLTKLLPDHLAMLPMAQTIWYIPTGLDIWNQKINRAPGHYTRGFAGRIENPPTPVVYWPDQQPLRSDAPLQERLGDWMTLVQRGQLLMPTAVSSALWRTRSTAGGYWRSWCSRASLTSRTAYIAIVPTRPATRRIAHARRWSWATRWVGTMRAT